MNTNYLQYKQRPGFEFKPNHRNTNTIRERRKRAEDELAERKLKEKERKPTSLKPGFERNLDALQLDELDWAWPVCVTPTKARTNEMIGSRFGLEATGYDDATGRWHTVVVELGSAMEVKQRRAAVTNEAGLATGAWRWQWSFMAGASRLEELGVHGAAGWRRRSSGSGVVHGWSLVEDVSWVVVWEDEGEGAAIVELELDMEKTKLKGRSFMAWGVDDCVCACVCVEGEEEAAMVGSLEGLFMVRVKREREGGGWV